MIFFQWCSTFYISDKIKELLLDFIFVEAVLRKVKRNKLALSEETTKLGETELEQKLQQLQEAHRVLESRFTRSMKEVAELSDEKQQLEHVVAQLQLETESIGACMVFASLNHLLEVT